MVGTLRNEIIDRSEFSPIATKIIDILGESLGDSKEPTERQVIVWLAALEAVKDAIADQAGIDLRAIEKRYDPLSS